MGPHNPLNFFMTRLLFMEQNKVNSLKAKSDKADVIIILDNPKILPERQAKSLPPVPFPPAAPKSPVPVEGWKGVKVGGWIRLGNATTNGGKLNPPDVYSGGQDSSNNNNNFVVDDEEEDDTTATTATTTSETVAAFGNLKVGGDDDDTEITEESSTFDQIVASSSSNVAVAPVERPKQLFPANSARNLGGIKRTSSIGRRNTVGASALVVKKAMQRPMMKKKSSSKNSASLLANNNSSPSSSGAED